MQNCENCDYVKFDGGCYLRKDFKRVENCELNTAKTLERENAKLTQALERACEWIGLNVACDDCPLHSDNSVKHDPVGCKAALIRYFKEGKQDG